MRQPELLKPFFADIHHNSAYTSKGEIILIFALIPNSGPTSLILCPGSHQEQPESPAGTHQPRVTHHSHQPHKL